MKEITSIEELIEEFEKEEWSKPYKDIDELFRDLGLIDESTTEEKRNRRTKEAIIDFIEKEFKEALLNKIDETSKYHIVTSDKELEVVQKALEILVFGVKNKRNSYVIGNESEYDVRIETTLLDDELNTLINLLDKFTTPDEKEKINNFLNKI